MVQKLRAKERRKARVVPLLKQKFESIRILPKKLGELRKAISHLASKQDAIKPSYG